ADSSRRGAGCEHFFVDARVSAEPAIALQRLNIDCDTRSRDWLLQQFKADIWFPTKERNSKGAELTKEVERECGVLLAPARRKKQKEALIYRNELVREKRNIGPQTVNKHRV